MQIKMAKRNENSLMTNNNDEEIGNNIFIPSFWAQHGFQTQTKPACLTGLIVNCS